MLHCRCTVGIPRENDVLVLERLGPVFEYEPGTVSGEIMYQWGWKDVFVVFGFPFSQSCGGCLTAVTWEAFIPGIFYLSQSNMYNTKEKSRAHSECLEFETAALCSVLNLGSHITTELTFLHQEHWCLRCNRQRSRHGPRLASRKRKQYRTNSGNGGTAWSRKWNNTKALRAETKLCHSRENDLRLQYVVRRGGRASSLSIRFLKHRSILLIVEDDTLTFTVLRTKN